MLSWQKTLTSTPPYQTAKRIHLVLQVSKLEPLQGVATHPATHHRLNIDGCQCRRPSWSLIFIEWVSDTGGQGVGGNWQTDSTQGSVDLNVICQIKHQTFYTEENREVGWHTGKVQRGYWILTQNRGMQTRKDWQEPTGIKFNVNNWDQKQLHLRST